MRNSDPRIHLKVVLLLLGLAVILLADRAVAQQGGSSLSTLGSLDTAEEESALQCFETAAEMCGATADGVNQATTPLPAQDEQKLNAIKQLATQRGLKAQVFMHLSTWQLQRAAYPMILRVASDVESPPVYILFLGMRNGEAIIYDQADRAQRETSLQSLTQHLTGQGLVVAPASAQSQALLIPSWRNPALALIIGAVCAVIAIRSRHLKSRATVSQRQSGAARFFSGVAVFLLVILPAAAALAGLSDLTTGRNMLKELSHRTQPIIESSIGAPATHPITDIDLVTAQRLHTQGVLFIDARDAPDYVGGHIRGAINVPAGSADRIRLGLSGISHQRETVVYCGLATCGKAREVAEVMQSLGYEKVFLYTDGYSKWPKKQN
jgi:rhodanese-related sulfurtransferase